jgi:hypothetical protein
VWFSKQGEATAGLVLEEKRARDLSVSEASRLFPFFESVRMGLFHISPAFDSQDEALAFDHRAVTEGRLKIGAST